MLINVFCVVLVMIYVFLLRDIGRFVFMVFFMIYIRINIKNIGNSNKNKEKNKRKRMFFYGF